MTETDLKLIAGGEKVHQVYQKIILSLENESLHPIAFALRNAFTVSESLPPVEGWRENAGTGVSGFLYGKFYELKRGALKGRHTECTLFEDHHPLFHFSFEAQVKQGCARVLNELRARGLNLILLSGDKQESVEALGQSLGFAPNEIHFEIDPCGKAALVAKTPSSMMVGDGINDSLALIRANVGVAVSGGMEAALRSSSVYMTEPSLDGLLELFKISSSGLKLIRRNLLVSLIYNVTGGTFALLGFINPLVAALLMPLSSAFILFTTWLSDRTTS